VGGASRSGKRAYAGPRWIKKVKERRGKWRGKGNKEKEKRKK
jgi:hypothetical protein